MSKLSEALARLRVIASALPEDDPDREELLSVEGDYPALMEWALRKYNDHRAQSDAADALASTYKSRSDSFSSRADSMKTIVKIIMEAASERKYQGAAATVSLKALPPKAIVTDESLLPEQFFKTERTLSKSLINDAIKNGEKIPGVSLDNGGETISIRSK